MKKNILFLMMSLVFVSATHATMLSDAWYAISHPLNYAIEARNQNNTMKAYVTFKQYVASVIDNLDAILAPQVQEEVVQEQVKPSMKARVGSFFNRMLPVSKSEVSTSVQAA